MCAFSETDVKEPWKWAFILFYYICAKIIAAIKYRGKRGSRVYICRGEYEFSGNPVTSYAGHPIGYCYCFFFPKEVPLLLHLNNLVSTGLTVRLSTAYAYVLADLKHDKKEVNDFQRGLRRNCYILDKSLNFNLLWPYSNLASTISAFFSRCVTYRVKPALSDVCDF